MASVFDQLADAFTRRKLALAEKDKPKTKLAGSDYFMPKSSKEELAKRQATLEESGLPGVLKEAGREMYENPVVNTAIGLSPGAGDLQSAFEAIKSAKEGDWTGAGLNAVGVLPFVPALAGTFVGKGASTWDAIQAAEAAKRLEAGENAAQIYKETGYGVAPWDKKMRSEISDVGATINPNIDVRHGYGVSTAKELTANERLKEAEQLIAEGYAPNKVYKLTGYVDRGNGLEDFYTPALPSIIEHKELAAAYPSLSNVKTEIAPYQTGVGGYYDPAKDSIKLYSADESWNKMPHTKSDMLHELTHAIQGREGWARGGSSKEMATEISNAYDKISDVNKQMDMLVRSMDSAKAAGNMEKYDMYKKMYEDAMDYKLTELVPIANLDPYQAYRSLAGEAEARLVQARAHMTPEELRSQYPYEPKYFEQATGIPLNKLITRFDEADLINKP